MLVPLFVVGARISAVAIQQVSIAMESPVVLAIVRGEVDAASCADIERELWAAAGRLPGPGLVVDLRDVSFLDSCGLNMLLRIRKQLVAADRAMRIVVRAGSTTQRVCEITDLGSIIAMHLRVGDALHAMSDGQGPPPPQPSRRGG